MICLIPGSVWKWECDNIITCVDAPRAIICLQSVTLPPLQVFHHISYLCSESASTWHRTRTVQYIVKLYEIIKCNITEWSFYANADSHITHPSHHILPFQAALSAFDTSQVTPMTHLLQQLFGFTETIF